MGDGGGGGIHSLLFSLMVLVHPGASVDGVLGDGAQLGHSPVVPWSVWKRSENGRDDRLSGWLVDGLRGVRVR